MIYTINHIATIMQGRFIQSCQDDVIEQILLDSRKLIFPKTSLFFALTGHRREGHQFIKELYERGMRNFVVYRNFDVSEYPEANIILVADTLRALHQLTAFHRQEFDIPVIGITGSNGKTIVKEWLNQLLDDEYNIVRSPKSYNSQIGVPLSVWQMNDKHELGIFEAGISQKGEMQNLEDIIRPTLGIFTNIGEAHNEGFENLQQKIREKLELFKHSAAIIYSRDQAEIETVISGWNKNKQQSDDVASSKLFSWGKGENATVRVLSIQKNTAESSIKINYQNEIFPFHIPFVDDAAIENAITCICTLLYLGHSSSSIEEKLQRLTPIAMRLELKNGINHCSVINDSYSADMSSLKIALDFFAQQRQHPKYTVILSDVLQTGKAEIILYKEIAGLLAEKKINRLIAIGEKINANKDAFDQLKNAELLFYPSTENFIHDFNQIQFRDEMILLKGARMFQFEKIDHLLSQQVHQTVLEISLDAIAHNLKQYQRLLEPSTKLMAMVKAFAYGAGSYEIARLLQFHKVDYLAVAYADEGVALRRSGIRLPILVMNTEENALRQLLEWQLEPVIFSSRGLESLRRILKKEAITFFPIHIELETGMNRLGFSAAQIPELVLGLSGNSFRVQSVFSHLAASEEAQQDAFTQIQFDLYQSLTDRIYESLGYPFLRHISNSAAIVRNPSFQLDMVRLGIGLYGIDPASSALLELKGAGTLKTTIAQIKHLEAGETVGYNRRGVAYQVMKIATVRLGYADGYPRTLGYGNGKLLYRGRLVPTIGSICMDMTMIDITEISDAREGDEIIVFGDGLAVDELARWAGTNAYDILAGISQRVKRVYFE